MLDQAIACRIYEQRPRVCRGVSAPAGAGLRHFRLDGRLVREGSPVWLADVQSLSWELVAPNMLFLRCLNPETPEGLLRQRQFFERG